MMKRLSRYISVGITQIIIYWIVFSVLVYLFSYSQTISNVIAFLIAVTFAFFANARFTFEVQATTKGYLLFAGFMVLLSFVSGRLSDYYSIHPIITLIEFSAISLICGFIFSKFVVFKKAQ